MASISVPIPISSPSISMLQKPRITHGSHVLRLPSMSKNMGKVSCSIEGKPAVTSDDSAQPSREGKGLIITGKSSWPELVGEKGEVAAAIIEKENPLVKAYVILEGTPIPLDFRTDRVWVVVNAEEVVIQIPAIG